MGNYRLVYKPLVISATLSCDDTASGYPVVNLQDEAKYTYWMGSVTAQISIDLDLGSAQAIDAAAIVGHNFTTAGVNLVRLYYGVNDHGITFDTAGFSWTVASDNDHFHLLTSATKRYWRLQVGAAGTATAHIGEIVLGTRHDVDYGPDWDSGFQDDYGIGVARTGGRRAYSTLRADDTLRIWDWKLTNIPTSSISALRAVWATQSGSLHPMALIEFDVTASYGDCKYVAMPATFPQEFVAPGGRSIRKFRIEEVF